MVGLAQRDRLFSDEFNGYADVLSRMTRDQIFVLGYYLSLFQPEADATANAQMARTNASITDRLVPNEFPSTFHIEYLFNQLTGLGLVIQPDDWEKIGYYPSPLLDEITELVDFGDVLAAEGPRGPRPSHRARGA